MSENMKIGFIGLGIMGRPMSKNLLKAGYHVVVSDLNKAAIEEVVAYGAETADNNTIAATCGMIVTMLPNSPHVKKLVLDSGMVGHCKPGTLIIDMTSGAPTDSKEIAEELAKRDVHFLDAPVSGGEPMAVAGTLAIMVGGDAADFERAKPLFDVMGGSATLVGPVGSGNTCKLTNQIIVAGNIAALSEGMMLAKKAGCDLPKVFEAIRGGLAGSTVMNAKTPMILADNFKPGFRIDLHIKDLTNAMNAGTAYHAPMPLTVELLELLKHLSANGDGASDHSAIAKYYEELTGTKFTD